MDNYIVSARKYRPDSFETVVGQDSVTQTLKNSIRISQLAQAYLFCGPRGVGKTTCARIFAKTINCTNPTADHEACNECESCVAFNKLRSLNIHELDAASNNSVEDIRNLIDQVRIPPQIGYYSVYIIDEVHMLSSAAFNAFLKTLEEPPKHVIFILATTEKHKIIPTILSRCQIFDFSRISVEDIRSRLEFVAERENIEAEHDALHIIAQKADGAMRDALSIFDQIVSFSGKNITYDTTIKNLNVLDYETYFEITRSFINADYISALRIFDNVLKKGFEANYFVSGLASHFRDLLVCKDPGTIDLLEVGKKTKQDYLLNSQACPIPFLFRSIEIANQCDLNYKQSQNKRLLVEIALLNICNLANRITGTTENVGSETIKLPEIKESVQPAPKEIEKKIEPTQTNIQNISSIKVEEPNSPAIKTETSESSETRVGIKSISLKDLAKEKDSALPSSNETNAASQHTTVAIDDFDDDKFNYVWNKYAETLNDNPRLFNFLTSHLPTKFRDYKYSLTVESLGVKNKLDSFINDTVLFMRKELNNSSFEIEYIVGETEQKKTYKTDEEKLQDMIQLNPDVKKLRDQLNLDFE